MTSILSSNIPEIIFGDREQQPLGSSSIFRAGGAFENTTKHFEGSDIQRESVGDLYVWNRHIDEPEAYWSCLMYGGRITIARTFHGQADSDSTFVDEIFTFQSAGFSLLGKKTFLVDDTQEYLCIVVMEKPRF